MGDQQKSEVQNLTGTTGATEHLDAAPLAEDAGHVAHGEPKTYDGDSSAVDHADDGEGYLTEDDRPDTDADRAGPSR